MENVMRTGIIIVAMSSIVLLSGCVPIVIAGGTEGAAVAAQERSAGNAVDDATTLLKIKNIFAQQDDKDMLANIEIKVVEGRVLLTGNVDHPDSQIEAVGLVW